MKPCLVDSSAWLHILAGTPESSAVMPYLDALEEVVVPTPVLFEVYRQLSRKVSEEEAVFALSQMERGKVVAPGAEVAVRAAELSIAHRLGAMDSLIYAAALAAGAELLTFDNDFRGIPGCRVL